MNSTPDTQNTFSAGASIRISGVALDMEGLTREFQHEPSHTHKQGQHNQLKEPYAQDMWSLSSPLGTNQPLDAHLKWLADVLLPHKEYILLLRETKKVDFYCYKSCYTEQASLVLSTEALRIFTELNLDLQVSLLCLPPDLENEQQAGDAA